MAESSQDGNLNVQKSTEKRRELFRQSLDDAAAKTRSEISDSTTATLGSVGKMDERDDFMSVSGSYPCSSKRPRVEEKEKVDKAARDMELKALEVKVMALENMWVANTEDILALKKKYTELNSKFYALERELRGS
ncbi:hypothetical protein FGADI_5663 [Fusarium gaditjirri]|uniref:Uncharacterized protein n=1 Tax=Fusarium gaditjirri TaxID=282569 RepID=A0A8H4T9R5_9HYPO|nr:hypothetical protein FGADI_5663 [Fusarium gaditjirri]